MFFLGLSSNENLKKKKDFLKTMSAFLGLSPNEILRNLNIEKYFMVEFQSYFHRN